MKIVCIGDSITYGYGVRPEQNWVHLSAEHSGQELINHGINGDTTGGMLARFTPHVLMLKPDAVIIMGGSNDIITDNSIEQPKRNLLAMLELARQNRIMPLVGVPVPMDVPNVGREWAMFFNPARAEALNRQYADWLGCCGQEQGVDLLDFRSLFAAQANMAGLYFDGLHPNPLGHRLMAELVSNRLCW